MCQNDGKRLFGKQEYEDDYELRDGDTMISKVNWHTEFVSEKNSALLEGIKNAKQARTREVSFNIKYDTEGNPWDNIGELYKQAKFVQPLIVTWKSRMGGIPVRHKIRIGFDSRITGSVQNDAEFYSMMVVWTDPIYDDEYFVYTFYELKKYRYYQER